MRLVGQVSQALELGFQKAGAWQTHQLVAFLAGRFAGQRHSLLAASQMWLVGQDSQSLVKGLRCWGGAQSHFP